MLFRAKQFAHMGAAPVHTYIEKIRGVVDTCAFVFLLLVMNNISDQSKLHHSRCQRQVYNPHDVAWRQCTSSNKPFRSI